MTVPLNEKPEPKSYQCGACGAKLTHAQARRHWDSECPKRKGAKTPTKGA